MGSKGVQLVILIALKEKRNTHQLETRITMGMSSFLNPSETETFLNNKRAPWGESGLKMPAELAAAKKKSSVES